MWGSRAHSSSLHVEFVDNEESVSQVFSFQLQLTAELEFGRCLMSRALCVWEREWDIEELQYMLHYSERPSPVLNQTMQPSASHRPKREQRRHARWRQVGAEELDLLILQLLRSTPSSREQSVTSHCLINLSNSWFHPWMYFKKRLWLYVTFSISLFQQLNWANWFSHWLT